MSAAQATPQNFHQRRRIDQAALDRICALHNRFTMGQPGGLRANLAYCDLSRLDFSGKNLVEADLTGAIFMDAIGDNTDLSRASLFCANFSGARLRNAKLMRVDMRGAIFRGADLTGSDLTGSDLREGSISTKSSFGDLRRLKVDNNVADARQTKFVSANLSRAKLSGVMAGQADFSDAVLRGANLERANLRNANFEGADLEGASMLAATIEGANFRNALIEGCDIAKTAPRAQTETAKRFEQPPSQVEFSERLKKHALWIASSGKEGARLEFENMDLRTLDFGLRPFLPAARLVRCLLGYINLSGASLMAADLSDSDFRGADLRGADLRGAKLENVNLARAVIDDINLDNFELVSGSALETRKEGVHVVNREI